MNIGPLDKVMVQLRGSSRLRPGTVQGQPHAAGGDTWVLVRFFIADDPTLSYGAILGVRLSEVLWVIEKGVLPWETSTSECGS